MATFWNPSRNKLAQCRDVNVTEISSGFKILHRKYLDLLLSTLDLFSGGYAEEEGILLENSIAASVFRDLIR